MFLSLSFESVLYQFSSVQLLSSVRLFVIPWTAAHQASLSNTNSQSLSNPCPLSQWCHPAISSSVVPFSSCPQSFPASGSFPMSQLFASGGQGIGVSASTSVLPMSTQDWFALGWTGWISLQPKELTSLLRLHSSKASILWHSAFFILILCQKDTWLANILSQFSLSFYYVHGLFDTVKN